MHRFLLTERIDPEKTSRALLPGDEAAHALRVLRLEVGAPICLSDGQKLWAAQIDETSGGQVWARVTGPLPDAESPARLTLYQGLPKADKMEWIAQKATELGAHRIIPVEMARSVVKQTAKDGARKQERWQRIAREAVKQCGRARCPEVLAPMSWRDALRDMAARELMLMPWEEAQGMTIKGAHAAHPGARDIGLLIGPEGGIDGAEAQAARDVGALAVTLGPRILRAETAAVAALALAGQCWGDLG